VTPLAFGSSSSRSEPLTGPELDFNYLIVGLLIFGAIQLAFYLSGNPQFWHAVAKYPDEAFDHFIEAPCWIVVDADAPLPSFPGGRNSYVGPFTLVVPKLGDRKVQVFGLADAIEASQQEFLEKLKDSGKLPNGAR
jgi:hypothetical protein